MKNKTIIVCEYCKIIGIRISTNYHVHHVDGHGVGETINLCSFHHNNLHGFIRKRSVQICELKNPKHFKQITQEYVDYLNDTRDKILDIKRK